MLIRRPVKSWQLSASVHGGYRRLFAKIAMCYAGRHDWAATFFMPECETGESCQVCGKRKDGKPDAA